MTFLPVADRELRVAARRKSTYRIRSWTAVTAIAMTWLFLGLSGLSSTRGAAGGEVFTVVAWYAFGLCLLAGVFLTADCLSEEKREGTLGLLFLTDLRGYDVVSGKFIARGLNAFYGLLAILPAMGIPLLVGGVTGGQFWKTALAMLNALFVSLAAGMLVSARGREPQRAMGGTLFILFLLVAGLPAAVEIGSLLHRSSAWSKLAWISPAWPFSCALKSAYRTHMEFWGALFASHMFGWCMLALASGWLPRHWQERCSAARLGRSSWRGLRGGSSERKAQGQERERLLSINPVLWLVGTQAGVRRIAWGTVLIWGAVAGSSALFGKERMVSFVMNGYVARPFGFLLKALLAAQACRFFVEARSNGALEMLLSTPLTSREIIRGQSLALRRSFLWPVLAFAGIMFLPDAIQVIRAVLIGRPEHLGEAALGSLVTGICAVRMLIDSYTVCVFAMALALTLKRPTMALGTAIVAVLILPSILCWFDVVANLVFIVWSSTKLQQDLRWVVARQTAAPVLAPVTARPPGTQVPRPVASV